MFRNKTKKHSRQLIFWIISLVIALLPILSSADFQDPTKPNYPPPIVSNSDSTQTNDIGLLSAIWITSTGKRATINGVTVREGQTLLNKVKVIKITKNTVSLRHDGNLKVLRLLPPLYRKSVNSNDTK